MNLRKLAQKAPYCMGCGLPNVDGHQLCLAHSNNLKDGRGFSHKADDDKGSAYLCYRCHDLVDGRRGGWDRHEKRMYLEIASIKSRDWEKRNGYSV